jgi:hypothetical protein
MNEGAANERETERENERVSEITFKLRHKTDKQNNGHYEMAGYRR